MREEWIDVVKGTGIILVIAGHSINPGLGVHAQLTLKAIFSFHMPLFFILSGWLFKFNRYEDSPWVFIIRRFRQLMIPFLVTFILLYGYYLLLWYVKIDQRCPSAVMIDMMKSVAYGTGLPVKIKSFNIAPVGPLWFLPCLFASETIFFLLMKILADRPPLVQVLCFGYVSYAGIQMGKMLPWSVDIALASQIFLFAGLWARRTDIFSLMSTPHLTLLSFAWLLDLYTGGLSMNSREYCNVLISYPGAIAGSFLLMHAIRRACGRKRTPTLMSWLAWLGASTIIVLGFHDQDRGFLHFEQSMQAVYGELFLHPVLLIVFRLLYSVAIVLLIRSVPLTNDLFFPYRRKATNADGTEFPQSAIDLPSSSFE
jgi:fucose 4-O-acetylase-like acetyltransferase